MTEQTPAVEVPAGRARIRPRAQLGLVRLSVSAAGWIGGVLVLLGVILRVRFYTANLSLWFDEAALAMNIKHDSYAQLLKPLRYSQAAPLGFLLVEKTFVKVLGDSEYALRAPTFLAGVVAVPVFLLAARRLMGPTAALTAVAYFALSFQLVYAAAELKQYSFDIATAALLLYVAARLDAGPLRWRQVAVFAAVGAGCVWLSHPSIFYLAGFGIVFAGSALLRREPQRLARLVVLGGVWLASFGALYLSTRSAIHHQQSLFQVGRGGYLSPGSDPTGVAYAAKDVLRYGFPLYAVVPAAILFAVGVASLALQNTRRCLLLVAPLVLVLVASMLHQYPVGDRFTVFYVPTIFCFVGIGLERLVLGTRDLLKRQGARPLGLAAAAATVTLGGLLVLPLAGKAAARLIDPVGRDQIKPGIAHLQAAWEKGDSLFLAGQTRLAFRYYAECRDCGLVDRGGRAADLWHHERLAAAEADLEGHHGLVSSPPALLVATDCAPEPACWLAQLDHARRVWLLWSATDGERMSLAVVVPALQGRYRLVSTLRRRGAELDLFVRKTG